MHSLTRIAVLAVTLLVVGCAHQINISTPLDALVATQVSQINKTVGYYISTEDRTKMVITLGGGGDRVKYLPYQESEPALNQVLSNLFTKVVAIPSLEDKQFITSNEIAFIFVPSIATDSSSESTFTWPPTRFTVTLDCEAVDPAGATVWQRRVKGEGKAEWSELLQDSSLSARRASKEAFLNLQREINAARAFR